MARKLALLFLGVLLAGIAFVLSPTLRAVAQNTACSMSQGGATWVVGSGCTISVQGGTISVISGTMGTGASGVISNAGTLTSTGTAAFSGTLGIPNGAAPAATCSVGAIFLDTDETVDTNCATTADNSLCLCVATNTWVSLENN